MITSALVVGTEAAPTRVFTASVTGENIPTSSRQDSAITTMMFCNVTAAPSIVAVYLVKDGDTPDNATFSNMVVNALEIPAGDTVFFSDERIILDGGDHVYVGSTVASAIAVTVSSLPV